MIKHAPRHLTEDNSPRGRRSSLRMSNNPMIHSFLTPDVWRVNIIPFLSPPSSCCATRLQHPLPSRTSKGSPTGRGVILTRQTRIIHLFDLIFTPWLSFPSFSHSFLDPSLFYVPCSFWSTSYYQYSPLTFSRKSSQR